jgi:hypothetical protein
LSGGFFNGALPIGLLMFLGTLFAFVQRKLGRKQAAKRFPAFAREFGLDYTAPRYTGNIGVISGTYRNRTVRIDPDDQRLIKVRFTGAPRIDLRSYEHAMRAPVDMITVYSGDRTFDRFFKTRFASEDVAARIANESAPRRLVEAFMGRYARQVQALTVTSDGIVCRLDFGSPPYIPEGALQDLLPACTALADLIEPSPPLPSPPSGTKSPPDETSDQSS